MHRWLAPAGQVTQLASTLDEAAAPPERQRDHHVERHQSHPGHGHPGVGWKALEECGDRVRTDLTGMRAALPGLFVGGVAGGHDHVVDDHDATVREPQLFGPVRSRHQINRWSAVMDDLERRRSCIDQSSVEPLQVLAHEPAGEEMVWLDRLSRGVYRAAIAHPPVPLRDDPVIQADPIGRMAGLVSKGIQRELAAGVVEQQVVGLRDVVDARSGGRRLDHADLHLEPGPESLPCRRDEPLERARTPRAEPDDRDAYQARPYPQRVDLQARTGPQVIRPSVCERGAALAELSRSAPGI